jgi:hypothetical protein
MARRGRKRRAVGTTVGVGRTSPRPPQGHGMGFVGSMWSPPRPPERPPQGRGRVPAKTLGGQSLHNEIVIRIRLAGHQRLDNPQPELGVPLFGHIDTALFGLMECRRFRDR